MTSTRSLVKLLLDENSRVFSDGGLETTLVFNEHIDLPGFAAYPLLFSNPQLLFGIASRYFGLARSFGATAFVYETPTWRSNPDWCALVDHQDVKDVNLEAIRQAVVFRDEMCAEVPVIISGVVGPRGDGYRVSLAMTPEEAAAYHTPQIAALASSSDVTLVTAYTLNYSAEAIGVARAARALDIPCVISFTVETDGRLASGETLADAFTAVDAATESYPLYFMINCAHPHHFAAALHAQRHVLEPRLRGLRPNASCKSHAELDNSAALDSGDVQALARDCAALQASFPRLTFFGGCCGTDERHLEAVARALLPSHTPR